MNTKCQAIHLFFIHYIMVQSFFPVYHQTDSTGAKVPTLELLFQWTKVPRKGSSIIPAGDVNSSHGQLVTAIFRWRVDHVLGWPMANWTFVTSWPPTSKGPETCSVAINNATDWNTFKFMVHSICMIITAIYLQLNSSQSHSQLVTVNASHHQIIKMTTCHWVNMFEFHLKQALREILHTVFSVDLFIRSTSKSRPNNIRGGKMSVRPYVCPSVHKKFHQFEWNLVYR